MGEEIEGEYTVQWRQKKPNGEGYFVIKDIMEGLSLNDYLFGDWDNGYLENGEIVFNETQTILYRGQFDAGYYNGSGVYVFDDGNYYLGEFKDGMFNGKGAIYDSSDVLLLEGYFKDDEYQE
jgi:hypothetical protein